MSDETLDLFSYFGEDPASEPVKKKGKGEEPVTAPPEVDPESSEVEDSDSGPVVLLPFEPPPPPDSPLADQVVETPAPVPVKASPISSRTVVPLDEKTSRPKKTTAAKAPKAKTAAVETKKAKASPAARLPELPTRKAGRKRTSDLPTRKHSVEENSLYSVGEPRLSEKDDRDILTVSEITHRVKGTLEETFPQIWVTGELSNVSQPKSGHIYLTLKDDRAQLSAVIWRNSAKKLRFDVEDGLEVVVRGRITVYPGRGNYQIIIDQMEPKGVGALQLAFEQLKARLAKEGLFDPAHKKPLPTLPRTIGVVTSPTGAAVRDIIKTIYRRYPHVRTVLYPVKVQGDGAREEVAQAIYDMNEMGGFDVLIIGRGGGSLEDLWAFNEEMVARAIYASEIPIISAVGHEIDFSISDMVADVRAATPTAAAELAVPRYDQLLKDVQSLRDRMVLALDSQISQYRTRLDSFRDSPAFQRPEEYVRQWEREVDEMGERLFRPYPEFLERMKERLDDRALRLILGGENAMALFKERLHALGDKLEAMSPLKILQRGYTLSMDRQQKVINQAADLQMGQEMITYFPDGSVISEVKEIVLKPSETQPVDLTDNPENQSDTEE